LSAAQTRWRRGHTRKQALVHMKELLTAAARVGGTTHLVAAVTSVLQRGPWYVIWYYSPPLIRTPLLQSTSSLVRGVTTFEGTNLLAFYYLFF
jgi:hypothetical protein